MTDKPKGAEMIQLMNVRRGWDQLLVYVGPFSTVLRFSSIDKFRPGVVIFQGLPVNLIKSMEGFLKKPEGTSLAQVSTPEGRILHMCIHQDPLFCILDLGDPDNPNVIHTIQLRREELQKLHDTLLSFWTC